MLEGAQAGLSWLTILKRRDAYRRAFAGFDPETVARFGTAEVAALLEGPSGVVRNRAKVASAVTNAAAFLALARELGSFDEFLWGFVDGVPVVNHWRTPAEVPSSTSRSEAVSAELRRRGFRFVGPTICYAHLQAAGLVVDHLTSCFRHPDAPAGRSTLGRPATDRPATDRPETGRPATDRHRRGGRADRRRSP